MLRLALHQLRCGGWHDALAAVGVAVAVACFTFLIALGLGIRAVIMEHVHPAGLVEVGKSRSTVDLWALRVGLGEATLDAGDIARLRAVDGVAEVHPRASLAVPAVATGGESLLGAGLTTELLVDGVPPGLVADELDRPERFRDPGDDDGGPCAPGGHCPEGQFCAPAWWPGGGRCQAMIPVVASPALVDLYNGTVRQAYGTPELSPDAAIGLTADVTFGRSTLASRGPAASERRRLQLVGYSRWAIPVGVTIPAAWVERLNGDLLADHEQAFHSAVVRPADPDRLAEVVARLRLDGFEPVESGAERAAALLGALLAAVAAAGLGVVAVAGTHITHVFLMHVLVRAREMALMRCVGARRRDVITLVLWQALIVGLAAGSVGIAGAVALGTVADGVVRSALVGLPLRPETLFAFPWWLLGGAVVAATVTCVGGALAPALRAARIDPSAGLKGG